MTCPTDKIQFDTQGDAVDRMVRDGLTGMVAYRCDFCPGWHMGHKNEALRKARRGRRAVNKMPTRGTVTRVWDL